MREQTALPHEPGEKMNDQLEPLFKCEKCLQALMFMLVALFGAVAKYASLASDGRVRPSFKGFITHVIISLFAGLMVWFLVESTGGGNTWFNGFLLGMTGYLGGKILEVLTLVAVGWIEKISGGKHGSNQQTKQTEQTKTPE